jgi:hypothetical protein
MKIRQSEEIQYKLSKTSSLPPPIRQKFNLLVLKISIQDYGFYEVNRKTYGFYSVYNHLYNQKEPEVKIEKSKRSFMICKNLLSQNLATTGCLKN